MSKASKRRSCPVLQKEIPADSLEATSVQRKHLAFSRADAQFGKAVFDLRAPFRQCRATLDKLPEISEDDLSDEEQEEGFVESRVWLVDDAQDPKTQLVLGRVLLGQSHFRLEALGQKSSDRLRAGFEKTLGFQVKFTGEVRGLGDA